MYLLGLILIFEDKECFGVFCVDDIDFDTCGDLCGTLHLTFRNGTTKKLQGAKVGWKVGLNKKTLKEVTHVQQSDRGCYTIFEGKKFNDKSMSLVGNSIHEHTGGWNIKSIDYDLSCGEMKGGMPAWVIGLAVMIVVVVGIITVLVMYCRKNKEAARDLILRMTGTQDTPVKCGTCKGIVADAI